MLFLDLWESFKKSKKLLLISTSLILGLSILLFFLLKIKSISPAIDNIMELVGFVATIYSVLLTIILYHFISLSEAEFVINSNLYVERNKQQILNKSLRLSNFIKDAIHSIHNDEPNTPVNIPADIRENFLYLKNLNKKHVNEKTTLYQCKETFDFLENLILEIKVNEVSDIKSINLDKLNELWEILLELTTNLDTIFNKE